MHRRQACTLVACAMLGLVGAMGRAAAESATGALVRTTAMSMKDDAVAPINAGKRRFKLRSATKKDPLGQRIVPPAPASTADPTLAGAALVVQNANGSGESFRIDLPASGWLRPGSPASPRGWVFRASDSTAAVTRVVMKADLLVIKGGKEHWGYTLDEAQQGRVAVRLQLGTASWCAEAPAKSRGTPPTTARNDRPGKFIAARKTPAPASCVVEAPTFQLTVRNGYGSGSYPAGTRVHVWAAVRPWDQLVTGWTGDAALLAEPAEWHSTLLMPARDATVTATIVDRPTTLDTLTYTGSTALPKTANHRIPAGGRGVVLMLHGTGGSAAFVTRTEAFQVALRLLEAGYGVLGPEAEESVAGDLDGNGRLRWNPALNAANVDFASLNALIVQLRGDGTIAATTPLFALGMSNGGVMAAGLGAIGASGVAATFPALRFRAVLSHCADARADAAALTATPTAFFMCQNDDDASVNADALASSQSIASRGVPTLYDVHPPSPLYPERLEREQAVAGPTALAVAGELLQFTNADGFFVATVDQLVAALTANPALAPTLTSLGTAEQRAVINQVGVMGAEHEMFSDWAARATAWFDAHDP